MYTAFIDTNIFIKLGMKFSSGILLELERYCEQGLITLVFTDVLVAELKKHKKKPALEAVERYISAKENLCSKYDAKIVDNCTNQQLQKQVLNREYSKIEQFFQLCNAKKISLDKLQLEQILDDYINTIPPFTNKKQYEFKDAMNINLIKYLKSQDAADDNNIVIISEDNGFIESFNLEEGYIIYNNLFEFISLVRTATDYFAHSISPLQQYLKGEEFDNYIVNGLESLEYKVFLDGYDDSDVIDVSNINVQDIDFSINEMNGMPYLGELYLTYSLDVEYEFFDPYTSPYDSEDKVFIYENIIHGKDTFLVHIELPFSFSFDNKNIIDRNIAVDDCEVQKELTDSIEVEVQFDGTQVELTEQDIDFDSYFDS